MRAEFDPRDPDVIIKVMDAIYEWRRERVSVTRSEPKYVTCSPGMYTLLQKQQANQPYYGTHKRLMGMNIRVRRKMTGYSLSINTRKPPSPQAQAKARAMKQMRKQITQLVKRMPFHSLINPPKVQPDGTWLANVSVQQPMQYITLDL